MSRSASRRGFIAWVLVMATWSSGCATAGGSDAGEEAEGWTPDQERKIGREAAPIIEVRYEGVYPDRATHDYLAGIVRNMAGHSTRAQEFDFTFEVLNSSQLNAFVLPGGKVYITRGLLARLETEAQFVTVIGHELGHMEHQHARLSQAEGGMSGLLSAPFRVVQGPSGKGSIVGGAVGFAGSVAKLAPELVNLRYSPDQELEAARRSVYFSVELGYDPRDVEGTFQLFEGLEAESGEDGAALFRTHPLDRGRVDAVLQIIRDDYPQVANAPAESFQRDPPAFDQLVASIREMASAYQLYDRAKQLLPPAQEPSAERLTEASQLLTLARETVPDEPLFALAMGEIFWLQNQHNEAIEFFVQALDIYEGFDPERTYWKPHFYVAVFALEHGDGELAVRQVGLALKRLPGQPYLYYLLGRGQELSGRLNQAILAYDAVLNMCPVRSDLYQLAQDRLNLLRRAGA